MKGRHKAYNLAILMVSSIFPHSQIVYNKATLAKFNAEVLFIQGNTNWYIRIYNITLRNPLK